MKCCSVATLNGASRTVTLAGRLPGSSGKFAAAKARRAAQRGGDVPHRRQMPHLLDRHLDQLAAPAAHGGDFLRAQALGLAVLETEGRIQVGAHQVVLELRRLVQRMQDLFATLKC